MSRRIALLRGINVGGNKMVGMADLRKLVTELGFTDVKTLLQSGNLIFAGGEQTSTELEAFLATQIENRLGVKCDILVRDDAQWKAIMDANPFPDQALSDPSHLVVLFMKEPPDNEAVEKLQAGIIGREVVRAVGHELFVIYPDGIGDSKLKIPFWGTARNWNTVTKLGALVGLLD